ncbi:AbrB/MazE/SpoVT family DNA-binding domain-containing protein [Candidatus Woesearchaeota archaeon]|nr:AbrB/MazE/SpoVT family DNA-binding domain-containing protein [Candidatus Woesearchaeota archaeon]MBW3015984.1 AbrB/MazE/SpoVT family DNA-binding domain-containing protein [Candidatus Woesearchaeota archaeon]
MRRKVIQIADSTQLVSLPRKWCVERGIKKGDELEVQLAGNKIMIATDHDLKTERVEVDVSSLDRTSIIYLIRGLYKKGYDDIKIICKKSITHHYKLKKDISVSSVIHQEVSRCPGLEIVEEKDGYCTLKVISNADPKELDNILRRTFILISDTCNDLIAASKTNDRVLFSSIEEKHDNVTRFINHSLRLINKRQEDSNNTYFLYHIIATMDKIIDILKDSGRNMLEYNKKLKPESSEILEQIHQAYGMFYELFYKFDLQKVHKINEMKEKIYRELIEKTKNVPKEEVLLLYNMYQSLETYRTLAEARMSMEF